ncbi:hypothetical protein D3C81_909570 [compost metagenome]
MTTTTSNANATVKVRAVVLDGSSNPVGMGLEQEVPLSDFFGSVAATTTQEGAMLQAVHIAQVAVPFADLTAAATAHNALLTALKNAGIMDPTP